jgi:hypothetical protein
MWKLVIVAVVAACSKGTKAEHDWSRTNYKQVDASTGGVAFAITLPENWEPRKPPDDGWGPTTGDPFKRPFVTIANVSLDLATSLESAIAAAGAKPENVVRKEAKNGNYAITEVHDDKLIRVAVFRRVGGSFLWCTASQANDDGIPGFEHTKQALVKICDSLTPKN